MDPINSLEHWLLYANHPSTIWNVYTLQFDAEEIAAEPNKEQIANSLLILAKQYKDVVWC